jgi:regulatory protein
MPVKTENEKSYDQALKYLKYRPRSRAETTNYLKGKNFSGQSIQQTIDRLESAALIDDREFARLWVENRRRFKPKGHYALKIELKSKGIEEHIIEAVLNAEDEEKNAWAAVRSKMIRWRQLGNEEIQKKVFSFLRSRGFGFEICLELSRRLGECSKMPEPDLS